MGVFFEIVIIFKDLLYCARTYHQDGFLCFILWFFAFFIYYEHVVNVLTMTRDKFEDTYVQSDEEDDETITNAT